MAGLNAPSGTRLGAALLAGAALLPRPASAADAGCPPPRGGALAEVGAELCRALHPLPAGTLAVGSSATSDAALSPPDQLEHRVTRVVAGALGVEAAPDLAPLGRARALASDRGSLLHVGLELRQGKLRVTAELYPVARGFWDRVRVPNPEPRRRAFTEVTIDAELRAFLPAVPLVAKRIDRAAAEEPLPLAVACGDTDADGAQEIVLVGRHRIRVGRIRKERFTALRTLAWADLSPLSRTPLRQPLGSAWIATNGDTDIGISDRLDAIRLSATPGAPLKLGRRVPWPAGGCSPLTGLAIRAEIGPCIVGDPAPLAVGFSGEVDALAGSTHVTRRGDKTVVRAARLANQGVVVLRDATGRQARLDGAGAQLAIADLDDDGEPELISTVDTLEPSADALLVHTWRDDGTLQQRLRVPVPSGVHAIATCAREDTASIKPIVVATANAVWVLR